MEAATKPPAREVDSQRVPPPEPHATHSEGQTSNKPSKKAKKVSPPPPPQPPLPPPPINFDYFDAPEEVCWSMTFGEGETWTPFIGDVKVEDAVREDWSTAFTYFTALNPSKFSPK